MLSLIIIEFPALYFITINPPHIAAYYFSLTLLLLFENKMPFDAKHIPIIPQTDSKMLRTGENWFLAQFRYILA